MKIAYRRNTLGAASLAMVRTANQIIAEYQALGYTLTLRQLYYRFVAASHIPNQDTEYKRLGDIIGKARYCGLIDWDAIEDRTRNSRANPHWETPGDIIDAAAQSYAVDKWARQPRRVEVWVEKEALAGIVGQVAEEMDVAHLACRGYMSASEMRVAAIRLMRYQRANQKPVIIHLGDHDPSGIDMTRDIEDRLAEFHKHHGYDAPTVNRIALNMDQVQSYNPPPNPAKLTDSRCSSYMDRFGDESWELDALPPDDLANLIRSSIGDYLDVDLYAEDKLTEDEGREQLLAAAARWDEVVAALGSPSTSCAEETQ